MSEFESVRSKIAILEREEEALATTQPLPPLGVVVTPIGVRLTILGPRPYEDAWDCRHEDGSPDVLSDTLMLRAMNGEGGWRIERPIGS